MDLQYSLDVHKSRQDRADKFKAKRHPLYIEAMLAARCYFKSFDLTQTGLSKRLQTYFPGLMSVAGGLHGAKDRL